MLKRGAEKWCLPKKAHHRDFHVCLLNSQKGFPGSLTVELQLEEESIPGKGDRGLCREVTEGDTC